jgi:hypothetical protein
MKIQPKNVRYYDLIRVPSGHIPAPLIRLWSSLPIPVKQIRTETLYRCPICGEPSFFKIRYACWECEIYMDDNQEFQKSVMRYYRRRLRREYFRNILKKIEQLILPFLILIGKAWYVRSPRLHQSDPEYQAELEMWIREMQIWRE